MHKQDFRTVGIARQSYGIVALDDRTHGQARPEQDGTVRVIIDPHLVTDPVFMVFSREVFKATVFHRLQPVLRPLDQCAQTFPLNR